MATKKKAVKKKAVIKKAAAKKSKAAKKSSKPAPKRKVAAAKKVAPKKKTTATKKTTVKKKSASKTTATKAIAKPAIRKKAAAKKKEKINYDDLEINHSANTVAGPLEFTPYAKMTKEEYMSEQQLDHFSRILLDWKTQLMSDVDLTVGHLQQEGVAYADPLDRAAQEEGFNLELRTRDRERKLIKKIEQALDWIAEGIYGYCEDCGAEIGIKRLEARPTAVKCIDCKTFSEIREKQVGG